MKLYTHDEMLDRVVGKKGTPRRDAMDAELQSYLIGEAIRQARKEKNLTQTQHFLSEAYRCRFVDNIRPVFPISPVSDRIAKAYPP